MSEIMSAGNDGIEYRFFQPKLDLDEMMVTEPEHRVEIDMPPAEGPIEAYMFNTREKSVHMLALQRDQLLHALAITVDKLWSMERAAREVSDG